MSAKVGIVIVNYNGASYQNDAMKSLYESDFKDFKVVVVDSASSDNSIELLEKEYPEVVVLRQIENVGVARGNNIGIEYCKSIGTEYTLLMNNDIEMDSKMLGVLVEKANTDVITVPKIFYYEPHDMIWYGGGYFNWKRGNAPHIGMNEYDKGQCDEERFVEYSPTTCMLIHNSVFDRLGKIDERYFMYWDDTDWCVRVADAGLKILYVPTAIMWHKVSSSTGGMASKVKLYYMNRNKLYFLKKHSKHISTLTWIRTYLRMYYLICVGFVKKNNNRIISKAIAHYRKGIDFRCDDI